MVRTPHLKLWWDGERGMLDVDPLSAPRSTTALYDLRCQLMRQRVITCFAGSTVNCLLPILQPKRMIC